jgi:hypothetical protein
MTQTAAEITTDFMVCTPMWVPLTSIRCGEPIRFRDIPLRQELEANN